MEAPLKKSAAEKLRPVLVPCGVACFFAAMLPCVLGPFSQAAAPISQTPEAIWAGSIVMGFALTAFSKLRGARWLRNMRLAAAWGALCFLIGHVPVLLDVLGLWVAADTLYMVCGFLCGVGLVLLSASWCAIVRNDEFWLCFAHVAAASAAAVVINIALMLLPSVAHVIALAVVLLFAVAAPLILVPVQETPDDQLDSSVSFSDLFFMLSSSTLGLMLCSMLVHVQRPKIIDGTFTEVSFGIAGAAVLSFAVCLLFRRKLTLPLLQWLVFPAVAGVFIVLDSFPTGTIPFHIGSLGVFVFFSVLGLFAVALLVKVNRQGEFSPLLTVGVSLACVAVASWLGAALAGSSLTEEDRGALLLALVTVYFVFLLASPAIQMRRIIKDNREAAAVLEGRQGSADPQAQEGKKGRELDFREHCDAVAKAYALSTREREVLQLASQGYTSTYIAKTLFISDSTVRSHLKSIYRKTGISSKVELIELVHAQKS